MRGESRERQGREEEGREGREGDPLILKERERGWCHWLYGKEERRDLGIRMVIWRERIYLDLSRDKWGARGGRGRGRGKGKGKKHWRIVNPNQNIPHSPIYSHLTNNIIIINIKLDGMTLKTMKGLNERERIETSTHSFKSLWVTIKVWDCEIEITVFRVRNVIWDK